MTHSVAGGDCSLQLGDLRTSPGSCSDKSLSPEGPKFAHVLTRSDLELSSCSNAAVAELCLIALPWLCSPPCTPRNYPGSRSISWDQQEQEESGEKEQKFRSPTRCPSECKSRQVAVPQRRGRVQEHGYF